MKEPDYSTSWLTACTPSELGPWCTISDRFPDFTLCGRKVNMGGIIMDGNPQRKCAACQAVQDGYSAVGHAA